MDKDNPFLYLLTLKFYAVPFIAVYKGSDTQ